MNNFLPTLISNLPSVIQETAIDITGVTQEQLSAAVDAAVALQLNQYMVTWECFGCYYQVF